MNQPRASVKPSAYRWVVFCLLAFGYLLVYFHRLCPAVVALDMQADLQTSGALLGFLAASFRFAFRLLGPTQNHYYILCPGRSRIHFFGHGRYSGVSNPGSDTGGVGRSHALCTHYENNDPLVQT